MTKPGDGDLRPTGLSLMMLWVVEIYPKGRRGQQRESKLSGQPGGQAHWESWVRALRSVEVIGSNP